MVAGGSHEVDVVVVGGGNAAFSAAHAARERGLRVLLLEKCTAEEAGGNSYYTAGAFRVAYDAVDDLVPLLDRETLELLPRVDLPSYSVDAYLGDMARLTEGRSDPELAQLLAGNSLETLHWLHGKGLRFRLAHERQTYFEDGKYRFFGGLAVATVDGGKGLMQQHAEAARLSGVDVRYSSEVTDLLTEDDRIQGVSYRTPMGAGEVRASAVILAAGGFEASRRMRAEHLGPEWERASVRGTPSNTGEVLRIALRHGAQAYGDWGSCHSVQWDAGAPPEGGSRDVTNAFTRQSYPIGIVVNRDGRRFLDEGADYRNYTYAKYGAEVLRQPGGIAFQIFDADLRPLLRTLEYDVEPVTGHRADSLPELAALIGVEPSALTSTVEDFNSSIADVPLVHSVKDGRAARTHPPKSHWAAAISTPPFYAYPVTCGITFTFGGVKVDERARVLDGDDRPLPGLYAAGEMVGGLFSGNYPGGSGLMSGAVFGRLAGAHAARGAV